MTKWTPEQQQAIEANNPELLISAAAGSGKTAVLIQRILRLLQGGASVDRMVIVTFTKAAAAQLREKLSQKLLEKAAEGDLVAKAQLALLPVTQIGTIHGFCGAILKEQFQVVGLDPGAKQLDTARKDKLFEKAMSDTLDACYENPAEAFGALSAAFSDKDIEAMARGLYGFMMSLRDPFGWLETHTTQCYSAQSLAAHPFIQVLLNLCRVQLTGLEDESDKLFKQMESPRANSKWLPVLQSDKQYYESLKAAAGSGYGALASLKGYKFATAPTILKLEGEELKWHEAMKKLRSRFKEGLQKAIEDIPAELEQKAQDLNRMQPCLQGLGEVVKTFHETFQAYKRQENGLDFNDLIHLTIDVLKNEEARKTIQGQYDHLFVDEYQDVGDAEEGIFQAIHYEKNNLFMVGDVKQSIYRFRLCDPTLFLNKQETFSLDENAAQRKIFLNKNFRSEPRVLSTVNQVFETVMTKAVTELAYDDLAHLYPGREENKCDRAELLLVPYEKYVDGQGVAVAKYLGEFECLAKRILAQRERAIFDGHTGQMRKTRFRDMTVLLPKIKGIGPDLAAYLKEYGIPAYADSEEAYFDLPEVQRMMALLNVLNNPRQDICFLSVLKLPLFAFSEEELADIRLAHGGKQVSFYEAFCHWAKENEKSLATLEKLDQWRFRIAHIPLDAMVWELMKESGLYLYAGTQKGGHVRQANLRLLCEYAANYVKVGQGGLDGFLRLGVSVGDEGEAKTAKALSPKDDLVRIMTIHKSKGLEFPVVYMLGLGGDLHLAENRKLRPHKNLGIGIPYVEPALRITRKTLAQTAITAQNVLEDKAERARLLYVGMTRAVEKLVMIGTASKLPNPNWDLSGEYGIFSAKSYLDWLCMVPNAGAQINQQLENPLSTTYPQTATPYDITVLPAFIPEAVDNVENLSTALSTLIHPFQGDLDALTLKRLERSNALAQEPLPLKTSVSAISKNAPLAAQEETMETKAAEAWAIPPLTMSELPALPSFMQQKTIGAADRGTAVHMALSKLAFEGDIQGELEQMVFRGLLTKEQRQSIPLKWLQGFEKSQLCQRMKKASEVKREWAFTYRLFPQHETLVQGVMDMCFLEEDGWVLCDYKTDAACDERTLLERYEKQVAIYKRALEDITGIPVKEAWLFALREGEAYEV